MKPTDEHSPSDIAIERVEWAEQHERLSRIRRAVFVQEQGVPEVDEWDGKDAAAFHFMAIDRTSGDAVATARLLPQGKLTRMAVLREWRGRGVGSQLLQFAEKHARSLTLDRLYLDAQLSAKNFYLAHGYQTGGDTFMDAGIVHIAMEKCLLDTDVHRLVQSQDTVDWLREFSRRAARTVDIFSQQLTPVLFADTELLDNLSALARRDARSRVRMLIRDTRPLQKGTHPLVQLARRLPSSIEIRRYTEGANDATSGFFCADGSDLIKFSDESVPAGFARRGARAESRALLDEFSRLWEHGSEADPDLRVLSI